jgi:hypothetical protein
VRDCNGREVRLGDRVKLWDGNRGTVVCSIDAGEYRPDYPEAEWGYLKSGVLIKSDTFGLFHYTEADEDFEVVGDGTP